MVASCASAKFITHSPGTTLSSVPLRIVIVAGIFCECNLGSIISASIDCGIPWIVVISMSGGRIAGLRRMSCVIFFDVSAVSAARYPPREDPIKIAF